jgi:hypothetical protein
LHRMVNVDKTEISVDGSKTNVGGRPAVSFHDPAVSLLPNLETAQQERSVLLLYEQKLLVKEEEVGLLRVPTLI